MAFPGFAQSFQRWRERRRQQRTEGDNPNVADPFDDFDSDVVQIFTEADGTDRFQKRKAVDYGVVFAEAAERSREKHRTTGKAADPVIAEMLLDFWATFFECFREDEQEFELAHFIDEAAAVQAQLDALPNDASPDLVTCRQVLYLMLCFARQRFESWSARFDEVALEYRQLQAETQSSQLTNSWLTDEMGHCRQLLTSAIKQRDMVMPRGPDGAEPRVSDLVATFLGVAAGPLPIRVHTGSFRRKSSSEETEETNYLADEEDSAESLRSHTTQAEAEGKLTEQVLEDLLTGRATVAKLNRVIGDRDLAVRLFEMSAEHRRFKGILSRIGLLTAY